MRPYIPCCALVSILCGVPGAIAVAHVDFNASAAHSDAIVAEDVELWRSQRKMDPIVASRILARGVFGVPVVKLRALLRHAHALHLLDQLTLIDVARFMQQQHQQSELLCSIFANSSWSGVHRVS